MRPVVVVGAGAAGVMAGIFAARTGAPVTVLETRPKPGAKIRISGGGRCNVLPSQFSLDDYHTTGSRNTMRNILYSWPHKDVQEFFEKELGIPLKIEETGKMFPQSDQSRDVVDALLSKLRSSGARLQPSTKVIGVSQLPDATFKLETEQGEFLTAKQLVLATGGLYIPKSGSDGGGYEIARALGHSRVPTYPALVPLLSTDSRWAQLSGVSVETRIDVWEGRQLVDSREGSLLFTHRGFSGPVILDVSRHVTMGGGKRTLRVHWGARDVEWDKVLSQPGKGTVGSVCRRHLPDRLAELLIGLADVDPAQRLSGLPRELRNKVVDVLGNFELPVSGSEGYRTAEVTTGGVPLAEVLPATLESRIVPGLHFCGEMLDVTGGLGGYNFLWAWVTGRKAGMSAGNLAETGSENSG